MSQIPATRLITLRGIGDPTGGDDIFPCIDMQAAVVLRRGEKVVRSWDASLSLGYWDTQKRRWRDAWKLDKRARVVLTDQRVAFVCQKYDTGSMWIGGGAAVFFTVGSKMLAKAKRHGKAAVGQLDHHCLEKVVTGGGTLFLFARDSDGADVRLAMRSFRGVPEGNASHALADATFQTAVESRLARRPEIWLTDDELARQRECVAPGFTPEPTGNGARWNLRYRLRVGMTPVLWAERNGGPAGQGSVTEPGTAEPEALSADDRADVSEAESPMLEAGVVEPAPAEAAPLEAASSTEGSCPACSAPCAPEDQFCVNCGAAFELTSSAAPASRACPACSEPAEGGERFCVSCGTALDPAAEPAAAVPVAEPDPDARAVDASAAAVVEMSPWEIVIAEALGHELPPGVDPNVVIAPVAAAASAEPPTIVEHEPGQPALLVDAVGAEIDPAGEPTPERLTCVACGETIDPDERFCTGCGTAVVRSAPEPGAEPIVARVVMGSPEPEPEIEPDPKPEVEPVGLTPAPEPMAPIAVLPVPAPAAPPLAAVEAPPVAAVEALVATVATARFCGECGTAYTDGAVKFCTTCGALR